MPTRPSEALLDEASEWIASQMSEEGVVVTGGFVILVLSMEWDALEKGASPDDRPAMTQSLCDRMAEENIKIGPIPEALSTEGMIPDIRAVPPDLVDNVLSWEDEFLGLAGISRRD